MNADREVSRHYSRGNLLSPSERGIDGGRRRSGSSYHRRARALRPVPRPRPGGDRGVAGLMPAGTPHHLLDIGSGIGGPARYFAHALRLPRHRHRSDAEFCDVARHLTRLLGLEGRMTFELGDALAMPFADGELRRRLLDERLDEHRRQGRRSTARSTACSSPAAGWCSRRSRRGAGDDLDYPTPWAASARASFLATPEETRRGLG